MPCGYRAARRASGVDGKPRKRTLRIRRAHDPQSAIPPNASEPTPARGAVERIEHAAKSPAVARRQPNAPHERSGGLGQFLFAVVLAGVLFAVIVTIKEWNQKPLSKASAGGTRAGRSPGHPIRSPRTIPAPTLLRPAGTRAGGECLSNQPGLPMDTALETSASRWLPKRRDMPTGRSKSNEVREQLSVDGCRAPCSRGRVGLPSESVPGHRPRTTARFATPIAAAPDVRYQQR